jgi:hypothetical protein
LSLDDIIKLAPLASATVACAAAFIAAVSAIFAGIQIRLAARTAVVQALQSFNKECQERELAIANADSTEAKEHAFLEFMNFLELYAGILNRNLLRGLARDLVRDRLIDSMIVIERAEGWHDAIDRAIFHTETFGELRRLMNNNRPILEQRRQAAATRIEIFEGAARAHSEFDSSHQVS